MNKVENFKENLRLTKPVFSLAIETSRTNRTTKALMLGMFIPVIVQAIIYFYGIYDNSWSFLQIEPNDLTGGDFYRRMLRVQLNAAFPYFYTMTALIVGTNMYREEINEDTITYIMTKPLPRNFIFLQKYLAYLRISFLISLPSLSVSYWLAVVCSIFYDQGFDYGGEGSTFTSYFVISIGNWLLLVIGLLLLLSTLGVIFITTGLLLNRPLLINLFIGFGILIEQILIDLIDNRIEPLYLAQNFIARTLHGFDQAFPGFLASRQIFGFGLDGTIINSIFIIIIGLWFGMKKSLSKEFW